MTDPEVAAAKPWPTPTIPGQTPHSTRFLECALNMSIADLNYRSKTTCVVGGFKSHMYGNKGFAMHFTWRPWGLAYATILHAKAMHH